ncbi:MAG: hypothetical protein VX833_03545 [Actinomycetota bacterium]|nr:hypothetical protein [Actinomycetota bacterium]
MMEFKATGEQALEEINNYVAAAGSKTTVRRITVCGDRDKPGTIIQLVEFDSHADAMVNNELEATQEASVDNNTGLGDVNFRNLDVLEVLEL